MAFMTALIALIATGVGIFEKKEEKGKRLTGWAITAIVLALAAFFASWYQACEERHKRLQEERKAITMGNVGIKALHEDLRVLATPLVDAFLTVNGKRRTSPDVAALADWSDPAQRAKLANIEQFNAQVTELTPQSLPDWNTYLCTYAGASLLRMKTNAQAYQNVIEEPLLKQAFEIADDPIAKKFGTLCVVAPVGGLNVLLTHSSTATLVDNIVRLDASLKQRVPSSPPQQPWSCFWWSWFHDSVG